MSGPGDEWTSAYEGMTTLGEIEEEIKEQWREGAVVHPPTYLDFEACVIGAVLLCEGEKMHEAVDQGLVAEDFQSLDRRIIWREMAALHEAGKPVTTLTVLDALDAKKKLDTAGGPAAVARYEALMPSTAVIAVHARRVVEDAVRRRLTLALDSGASIVKERRPIPETVSAIESEIARASDRGSTKDAAPARVLIESFMARLEDRAENFDESRSGLVGFRSGFPALDKLTGGFAPGSLFILGARPSQGKTAASVQMMIHVCIEEKIPTLMFSVEQRASEIIERAIACRGSIPLNTIRAENPQPKDWLRITSTTGEISDAPLWIDDTSAITIDEIRHKARKAKREHGIGLIVVDYLQLVKTKSRRRDETKAEEIGEITSTLKQIARETESCVICLSQLNRGLESRSDKRPMMSDLRDCLPVDEWVYTATGPTRIGDRPALVASIGRDGAELRSSSYIPKRYNGIYVVDTQFGSFRATARHPVLTGTGWKYVRDLVPGRDVIASALRVPHANRGAMPHARLLGWLLGNGCLSGGTPGLVYRRELHDEVVAAVQSFGVRVAPRLEQKSPNVLDVYLSSDANCKANPLMTWVRSLGLEGFRSHEKTIPAVYLGSSDDTHRDLLRGLWETDGCVTRGRAKYATTNETLARQVSWLLLTLGIRSVVSVELSERNRPLFTVGVSVCDNERMRPIVANRARFPRLSSPSTRYADPSPAIFVELAAEMYRGKRKIQRRANGEAKLIGKEVMRKIVEETPGLSTIQESPYMTMNGVGWGRLRRVKKLDGDVRVADLSVDETHNFITNGIVVHNSGSIEADADVIGFLYREEYYLKDKCPASTKGTCEIIIGKNRNGATGSTILRWVPEQVRFENLHDDHGF